MKRDTASQLVAVVTSTGQGGEQARKRYGFQYASTDYRQVLEDPAIQVAAIVTPPDVVSQLALAVPMCILYEIGIWAAQLFIKHTKAPGTAEEETASS